MDPASHVLNLPVPELLGWSVILLFCIWRLLHDDSPVSRLVWLALLLDALWMLAVGTAPFDAAPPLLHLALVALVITLMCRRSPGLVTARAEQEENPSDQLSREVLERREVERALQESENKYRTILDRANDAIVLADVGTGIIVDCNLETERLTGRERRQIIGMRLNDLYPPERAVYHRHAFERLLNSGGHTAELDVLHRTGKAIPVEVSAGSYPLDGRELAVGIFRDISERKHIEQSLREHRDELERQVAARTGELQETNRCLEQEIAERREAEVALRRSRLRLAEAQRIAGLGSWEWDADRDELGWSEDASRILGLPSDRLRSIEAFAATVHPADRAAFLDGLEQSLKQSHPYSRELRIVTPDGDVRTVQLEGEPGGRSESGDRRMLGTIQDVTERKRIEIELRQARANLERRVDERTRELQAANASLMFTRFSTDQVRDCIYWIGADGGFIDTNESACRSLGYSRHELLDMRVWQIDASYQHDWPGHWNEVRRKGSITFESTHRRRDGAIFPVEVTANYIEYRSEAYICAFVRDISERKRAEEALQRQLYTGEVLLAVSARFAGPDDFKTAFGAAIGELAELVGAECACVRPVNGSRFLADGRNCFDDCEVADFSEEEERLDLLERGDVLLREARSGPRLVVPITTGERLTAVMVFHRPRRLTECSEGHFAMLKVAARLISGAMERFDAESRTLAVLEENRRLVRQLMEVQEQERAHLARELHDEIGQCLTAIRADAQSIRRQSESDNPRIYASAEAIADVSGRIYRVMRNIMRRLRPELLDDLGLTEALRVLINDWKGRYPDIEWQLSVSGDPGELAEACKINAFRVVQEALNNALKHASPGCVRVSLHQQDGPEPGFEVVIEDDGGGAAAIDGGFGILGMRERVLATGGRFDAANRGTGFRVCAFFPIRRKEE